jgi:gentisate 1,2-dioxygenase
VHKEFKERQALQVRLDLQVLQEAQEQREQLDQLELKEMWAQLDLLVPQEPQV